MRAIVSDTRGRLTFIIFAACIVLIAVGLVVLALVSTAGAAENYQVSAGDIIYDANNQLKSPSSDATVKKTWTNEWELVEGSKSTNLGKNAVVYNPSGLYLQMFGGAHRVFADASVETVAKHAVIDNLSASAFYKLDDRKYLMTGSSIADDSGSISANNYLIVVLDKLGNAWLMNGQMNIKTVSSLLLTSGEYNFDASRELLITNETTVDLSRIQGSTNEYEKSVADVIDSAVEGAVLGSTAASLGSSTSSTSSTSSSSNNSSSAVVGTIGSSSDSSSSSESTTDTTTKSSSKPTVAITGAVSTPTAISMSYSVNDPLGECSTVFADISRVVNDEVESTERVYLNATSTEKTFYGLTPGSRYQIQISYSTFSSDSADSLDNQSDFVSISTANISASIAVLKLSTSKIFVNVKLDPYYVLSSADLVYKLNGLEVDSQEIDINSAIGSSGWTTVFTNTSTLSTDELRFEIGNAKYQDTDVTLNAACVIRNSAIL